MAFLFLLSNSFQLFGMGMSVGVGLVLFEWRVEKEFNQFKMFCICGHAMGP